MISLPRLRLSTRIILVLSTLVTTIFMAQAAYTITQNDADRLRAIKLRAELTTATQATALSGPLWDYDKERAQGNLTGLLKDPDIISAIVVDDAGEAFVSLDAAGASEIEAPFDSNAFMQVLQDIEYVNDSGVSRRVGKIIVTVSTARIAMAFKADLVSTGISGLLILVVLITGLSIAIRTFTRPIMNMSALMRLRVDGDYTTGVNADYIARDDEIGDIARSLEADQKSRQDEARLLEITSAIATQLDLGVLLTQIMDASSDLLDAERSTLFLYDTEKDILWSRVAQGISDMTITLKPGEGIAGNVFKTGQAEIIADPYQDARFNRDIDSTTGFETRNMLCLPIRNKKNRRIGVAQILNKRNAEFTEHDIKRLTSLTAQASAAIENAQLFDSVLTMRNYNESILRSLTNGVVSLDEEQRIQKLNAAARRILGLDDDVVNGDKLSAVLGPDNRWVIDLLEQVESSGDPRQMMDNVLSLPDTGDVAVNLSTAPLFDLEDKPAGFLSVFEDISQEKRVRSTMSRYMPSKIVDQLLESGEDTLGGVSQKATVLFSDIRSFTTISEKIGARATVAMLNEYFSGMVDLIDQYDGILDKYIGDAIMAVFGAPFITDQDAENAVLAAWDMFDVLDALNRERMARGDAEIKIGLGLNTGDVVVGNIGSARRMDYTVIGDAVNLAARLEGATKQYGARFLISEFTWAEIPPTLQAGFRFVDLMRVKGKLEPVGVYEGIDRHEIAEDQAINWQSAITDYRSKNWTVARAGFESAIRLQSSGDAMAQIYLDRIAIFEIDPPAEDWDGVWVMETK